MIRDAGAGAAGEREQFALRYGPMVRAYLAARWRQSAWSGELEDAAQEVFLECFRAGGALERASPERPGGFRAFLYGLVRNVALRFESSAARRQRLAAAGADHLDEVVADDTKLSQAFDRSWAEAIMRDAAALQSARAEQRGAGAARRVELLRLRFHDGLTIAEIAARWQDDAARLHHEYARAREEFKEALLEVMAFYHPDEPQLARREAAELVALLE